MRSGAGEPGPAASLVALHGFTQGGWMWDEVAVQLRRPLLAPDLPGHGGASPVSSWAVAVEGVAAICAAVGGATALAGYSMGGRIALAVALERPEVVGRVVVLAASPGMADPEERAARRAADEARARRLEEIGTAAFVDEWLARPMFAGLQQRGAAWLAAERERRRAHDAAGLAAALRVFGPGSQPFLGERLGELAAPALFVAGERDEAYVAVAAGMAAAAPAGELAIVAGAGHAVVGEAPESVAELIGHFVA